MVTAELRIGLLAKRTGTSTATIRFYEEIGLIPQARRQEDGQRRYSESDVSRLQIIRRCREFGFSVDQVRELMAVYEGADSECDDAANLAREHLATIRAKVAELSKLERDISNLVARCEDGRSGGSGAGCVVFEVSGASSGSRCGG